VLIRLDPETFKLVLRQAEATLAAAKAEEELARREFERKKDLVSDHTVSQAVFDQARAKHQLAVARVEQARAALGLARHRLEQTSIRAPAAGAVTSRMVAAGQWVDVGQPLLELATGSRLKVVARVPSSFAGKLRGEFEFFAGTEERPRTAKIFSVDPLINERSRSYEVVGTTPAKGLKAGAFARVRLESAREESELYLPVEAVVVSDTPRVLVVSEGKVAVRRVRTGQRRDGKVEILSGLKANEEVIASVAGLSRGLPVEVLK